MTDHVWPDFRIEDNIFSPLGIEYIAAHCQTEKDVIQIAGQADAIMTIHAPLSKSVIHSLKRCKIISVSGSGYNSIDIDAVSSAGILLANCPDYCVEEVADHTMALILSCARGIFLFDRRVRENVWDFNSAGNLTRISQSVLGLIGFGLNSRAVAARAKCFGMKVLAFDPNVADDVFHHAGIQQAGMRDVLTEADYVSIHTPLNTHTSNLISKSEMVMMKSSAFIINTSRGGVVDDAALYEALTNGTIRGAALDVLEKERPDANNALLALDNVLVTPHAAFYSDNAMEEVRTRSAQAVVSVFNGMLPDHIINKEIIKNKKMRMKAN